MSLKISFFAMVVVFGACKIRSNETAVLSTRFAQSPQPHTPDYASNESWAALPNKKDAADIAPEGEQDNQNTATADVFFIHPTTYLDAPEDSFQWNADINNRKLNEVVDSRPIKYQASVFNGACKVYAPRYRQAHYYSFRTPNEEDRISALNLAYSDIKSAFEYYLKHYNQGRPIVIAGHSQGTILAVRLLQEYFQNSPLKNQLVAAYIIGMPVPTDSLPYLVPCADSSQTQCYISWRTFLYGFYPTWQTGDHTKLVCQNPLSWNLDTNFMSSEYNRGAVLRSFNKIYENVCGAKVYNGLLWVSKPRFPGSKLYKNPNYHVGDYNLFYMNIRHNVELRVNEYIHLKK